MAAKINLSEYTVAVPLLVATDASGKYVYGYQGSALVGEFTEAELARHVESGALAKLKATTRARTSTSTSTNQGKDTSTSTNQGKDTSTDGSTQGADANTSTS